MAVMKRNLSSAEERRSDITPKWDDIQICLITMRAWAKPDRQWFEWPLLALKPLVALVGPALLIYRNALMQPYLFLHVVHKEMKGIAVPVGFGCLAASALLVGIGVIELFRRRRKQAVWDFVFALLALNSWMLCASVTVNVK